MNRSLHLDGYFLGLITGPLFGTRSKPELSNLSFALPAKLCESGITTALCTDHQMVPENYLMLCAALAVKNGMQEYDALAAITMLPHVSLELIPESVPLRRVKDADIVLYDRHPFDLFAKVRLVMVDGHVAYQTF